MPQSSPFDSYALHVTDFRRFAVAATDINVMVFNLCHDTNDGSDTDEATWLKTRVESNIYHSQLGHRSIARSLSFGMEERRTPDESVRKRRLYVRYPDN